MTRQRSLNELMLSKSVVNRRFGQLRPRGVLLLCFWRSGASSSTVLDGLGRAPQSTFKLLVISSRNLLVIEEPTRKGPLSVECVR